MYTRRVTAGEFQLVNTWLIKELVRLGLWNDRVRNQLIANGGSVQNIAEISAVRSGDPHRQATLIRLDPPIP